jgi:glycosyltransferase involved in cell wall biosynthesis
LNIPHGEAGSTAKSDTPTRAPIVPLVSIIIATYNCATTIEQTIRSVTSQDFVGLELIIIDGGSNDGTLDIIKNHARAIDYWLSEPDRGVYDAFNKGIALAHGTWLYFLGGDDRFADDHVLQRVFSRPLKGKMIYGNVLLEGAGPMKRKNKVYDGKFSKAKLCLRNICQQAIFYHHSLFDTLGKFNLKYPILADYAFNLKAFAAEGTKPHFVDTSIAIFWDEGLSGQYTDLAFEQDRPALVKKFYGFPYVFLFIVVKNIISLVVWVAKIVGQKTKWRNKREKDGS